MLERRLPRTNVILEYNYPFVPVDKEHTGDNIHSPAFVER